MKLNLGCGDHILDGWINADISLEALGEDYGDAVLLDRVSQTLPWDDDTFDQVLMAHTLEHIILEDGVESTDPFLWARDMAGDRVFIPTVQSTLAEARRVLKPGGSLLAICPDVQRVLAFLVNLDNDSVGKGGPWERVSQWYSHPEPNSPFLRKGALKQWYRGHVDEGGVDLSPWKEAGPFTVRDVELLVESLVATFLDMVLEGQPYLPHCDHRWNPYQKRLEALVGEHFDEITSLDHSTTAFMVKNARSSAVWIDDNGDEWDTRSWSTFNCAVLAQ